MKTRYLRFDDLFELKCKTCGSSNVSIDTDNCEECGISVNASCNNCNAEYKEHDFKKIKVDEQI